MRTLWYLCLFSCIVACGKIDLSEDTPKPQTSDIVVADTFSISNLASINIGDMVAVKGFLVGYCQGTSLNNATNVLPSEANTNFLLSDERTLELSKEVFSVGLNKNNAFHANWNLVQHPELLGKYILVYGKVQTYFGIKGIREPKKIELLPYPPEKKSADSDTMNIHSNDTVSPLQFLNLKAYQTVTLKGYIVGTLKGTTLSSAVFGKPDRNATNLLLAPTATTTDVTKIVPIRLKDQSDERKTLDIYTHPELLGCELIVRGMITPYFGVNGITNIDTYRFGKKTTPSPVTPTPIIPTPPDTIVSPKRPTEPIISDSTAVIDGRSRSLKRHH